jgi:diguanylate cyclase (GGDEF)-like protein
MLHSCHSVGASPLPPASNFARDEVLRRVGALTLRTCRRHDLAARFGGEEFAMILTGVDHAQALVAFTRVRAAVAGEPWWQLHPELHLTVCIGVAHEDEASPPGQRHGMLATADARLYAAKRGGRHRVVGDDTTSPPGLAAPAGPATAR